MVKSSEQVKRNTQTSFGYVLYNLMVSWDSNYAATDLKALRGAGASFGIVTEFIFETQPEPASSIEYHFQFK
jgi:hypothetical protein